MFEWLKNIWNWVVEKFSFGHIIEHRVNDILQKSNYASLASGEKVILENIQRIMKENKPLLVINATPTVYDDLMFLDGSLVFTRGMFINTYTLSKPLVTIVNKDGRTSFEVHGEKLGDPVKSKLVPGDVTT